MEQFIPKARVLVVVKTYPLPSRRYDELVCTAGLLDGERWIRIYPIPFRSMSAEEQFKKWEWIELDLEKRPGNKDFRIESYQPRRGIDEPIRVVGGINGRQKDAWALKRHYLLRHVQTSLEPVIRQAKADWTSLAVVKPEILGVKVTKETAMVPASSQQGFLDLVPAAERKGALTPVRTLPYQFSYIFKTDDGKTRTLMIEDWEIGALYWNALTPDRTPEEARDLVVKRLEDYGTNRDMNFIVGTTKEHHFSPSPFVIIGLFYPPLLETFGQGDFGF